MASDSTLPGDAGATGAEFAWASSVEGSWDVASNWNDVTAGQNPASVAPGPNDAVLVAAAGGGAVTIISGTGASSSLTLQGATLLDGQFATGTFSIATTPNVWDGAGSLTLDAGDTLTVTGDRYHRPTRPAHHQQRWRVDRRWQFQWGVQSAFAERRLY